MKDRRLSIRTHERTGNMEEKLLELTHVSKRFPVGKGKSIDAVKDVSFAVKSGESLGIVGESGCG